jgi:hypothetical protein
MPSANFDHVVEMTVTGFPIAIASRRCVSKPDEDLDMQDRQPTIEDVARVGGVSRATASRVINNGPGASDDARSRVRQVVDRLGYRPNSAARMLASGRMNVIDLVVADEADVSHFGVNPYFSRVVAGMMSALVGADTQLRVQVFTEGNARQSVDEIARATTHPPVCDLGRQRSPRSSPLSARRL